MPTCSTPHGGRRCRRDPHRQAVEVLSLSRTACALRASGGAAKFPRRGRGRTTGMKHRVADRRRAGRNRRGIRRQPCVLFLIFVRSRSSRMRIRRSSPRNAQSARIVALAADARPGRLCANPPSKDEQEAAKNTFACQLSGERLVIRFDAGEARAADARRRRSSTRSRVLPGSAFPTASSSFAARARTCSSCGTERDAARGLPAFSGPREAIARMSNRTSPSLAPRRRHRPSVTEA